LLHFLWIKVTAFGEAGEMLPVAGALLVCLVLERAWSQAKTWAVVVLCSLTIVGVSKLLFAGWGIGGSFNFTGISGHSTLGTLMLSSAAYLLAQQSDATTQRRAFVFGTILGMIVGASRMALHVHSFSEVVAGWILGCAGGLCFVLRCRLSSPLTQRPALVAVVAYALVFIVGNYPLPTQRWLNDLAQNISGRPVAFYRDGIPH
jgi:membrane-associated phospholipid phosphatase